MRTDALLAERLYDKLRAEGLSAWWDKVRAAHPTTRAPLSTLRRQQSHMPS